MRFGWLTLSLSPAPEEDAVRIDQQIEQVRFAEQLGFGDVWLTEHYFTRESVYNDALLFASAVAMRTERIRIGSRSCSCRSTIRCGSPSSWRCSTI
jgi:alkanesulfonate monooxygenase SsuD/methylene tetrahydromethanopterin reductase-like flavin-dependent oxidoreductase (luciferase family)